MISKQEKGRGSSLKLDNPFLKNSLSQEIIEGIDEWESSHSKTTVFKESPNSILSKNSSPDIPYQWSLNPYQGCEHGCIYCYARNSHTYWGFDAGIDFESKIVVKENAPKLLAQEFRSLKWMPSVIMLSGNTDCYQPIERKLKITQAILQVALDHRNPIGVITKNALILRDIDILQDLARKSLVKVIISITSLNEDLRRKLEPRTSSAAKKMEVVKKLSEAGIPVGVLIGPVIPGLNDHEIPSIMKKASEMGAQSAAYTCIRLNGQLNILFEDWLQNHFPNKKDKVISQIKALHEGKLNDSQFKRRMKGSGAWAQTIHDVFEISSQKYFKHVSDFKYDFSKFRGDTQASLFDCL
jgi:DNA repair photolyase